MWWWRWWIPCQLHDERFTETWYIILPVHGNEQQRNLAFRSLEIDSEKWNKTIFVWRNHRLDAKSIPEQQNCWWTCYESTLCHTLASRLIQSIQLTSQRRKQRKINRNSMLLDIGVTRADVEWAWSLPLPQGAWNAPRVEEAEVHFLPCLIACWWNLKRSGKGRFNRQLWHGDGLSIARIGSDPDFFNEFAVFQPTYKKVPSANGFFHFRSDQDSRLPGMSCMGQTDKRSNFGHGHYCQKSLSRERPCRL